MVAFLTLSLLGTLIYMGNPSAVAVGPGTIDGTVFVDVNENGANNSEDGLAGITVTAWNDAGIAVASDTTDASGDYSITGLVDGTAYRIEFTDVPAGYISGPRGVDSETAVTFATSEAAGVDFGVVEEIVCTGSLPTGALLETYNTAANCGVVNDPLMPQDTFGLVSVENLVPASGRVDQTATTPMQHMTDWEIDTLGNTFGITIDSFRGDIYVAASSNYSSAYYTESTGALRPATVRYGDIGGGAEDLGAAGTVYQLDAVTGTPTVFAQLPQQSATFTHEACDAFGSAGITRTTGVGLGNTVYDPVHDQIFVSNWEDGHIYRLNMQGEILDAYDPDASDDGSAGYANGDVPWALALDAASGRLFWGTMFSQEIHSVDLNAGRFTGTSSVNGAGDTIFEDSPSETLNMTVDTSIPDDPNYVTPSWFTPEYHLSDLELLPSGEMLLGVRVGCGNNVHSGYNHFGQTRLLTPNGSGFYDTASAAFDVASESTGATNYAEEDNYGGVAHYVDAGGNVDYVITTSDFDGEGDGHGIVAFPDSSALGTPVTPAGLAAYAVDDDPKGIGGEVQVLNAITCPVPEIEIGNYVWLDLDRDGVQDPSETPLEGVTVTLYAGDGFTVLATTTTGPDGEYVFTAVDGVEVDTDYEIGFDLSTLSTTLPGGFTSAELSETVADNATGTNADARDSDLSSGRITTTTARETDHTLDAGFVLPTFDLALQKTLAAGPTPTLLGAPATFNLTITNQGAAVQTIEVTDYVTAGAFTYDQADNPAGAVTDSGNGDSFTYTWGATPTVTIVGDDLANGESVTIPIVLDVDPNFDGTIALDNWAEISNFDSDQNAGNGDASDGTIADDDSTPDAIDGSDGSQGPGEDASGDHVDDEIDEEGNAGGDEDDHDVAELKWYDLTLIKERSAAQSYAIDLSAVPPVASFDITVGNQSPFAATAIQVTDYLPSGTIVAASQPAMPTQTANLAPVTVTETAPTYTIDALASGDSVTFSILIEITDASQSPFVNEAEISAFLGEDGEAAADIDSSADAIDGNDPLIVDPLNPDNEGNSHNDLGYDPNNNSNLNEATPGDEDDHDAEIVVTEFDLALRKTVNPSSANVPGGPITFDLTIINQGRPVQTVEVTDYVPAELTYSVADNPAGSVDSGDGEFLNYSWDAGSPVVTITGAWLDSGEQITIPIVLQVDPNWDGSDIENWAEISNFDSDQNAGNGDASTGALLDTDSTPDAIDGSDGSQGAGEDPAQDHGDDVVDNTGGDEDDHDVASLVWHDLTLIKERAAGQPYVVDITATPPTARYSITVGNQGNGDATLITVTDYVPTGMTVAAVQPAMPTLTNGGVAVTVTETAPTYVINSLNADDSVTFDITLEITDISIAEFVNAAEITSFADASGAPAVDVDSTPDATPGDPIVADPSNLDNENNSHNDLAYDPDNDGNLNEPTPGDEDDHDQEVVTIVLAPAIDIEKDTNGVQADTGNGPLILAGQAVNWTFVVENVGTVGLSDVVVTDTVTTSNGTVADPLGVVCDWATSSDPATPARNLSLGETVTCTSSSTAEIGQYANNSDVRGTPVADATTADPDAPVRLDDANGDPIPDVTDEDPSAYFGPNASIDIEKDTNGNQADTIGAQDAYSIGDAIVWTFEIENDGNVDLANVTVTDTVTTDNGTAADPAGVVCDWATSSDATTPAGNLSVGETVTCTSSSTAEAGQYRNDADVVGTPVADAVTADPVSPTPLQDVDGNNLVDVTDDDPSHYFGTPVPSIDIEKDTNGNQADTIGAQDVLAIGAAVTWTFEVENTGDVDLADVVVTDVVTIDNGTAADPAGVVCDWATSSDPATPARNLSVGETVTCTSSSIAEPGQYGNNSDVTGTPVADATTADPDAPVRLQDIAGDDLADVTDEDPSHYFAVATPSVDIEKDTNGFQADTGMGPLVFEGDPVTWTFEVENTGNVALGNVTVTDTVTTDNGTTADPAGVVCDWANSSDATTGPDILSVGETVTCSASSTAELGQYTNNSNVSGTPLDSNGTPLLDESGVPVPNVTDQDPSAYFGPEASIDIEKDTNGNQADTQAAQDIYSIGDAIVWTFEVENTGNVDLANVTVTDTVTIGNGTTPDPAGVVCDWATSSDATTPAGNLSVGETVTCTSSSTAAAGQYRNLADVVGTPVADAVTADPVNPTPLEDETGSDLPNVTDNDPSHYYATPLPAIDIEKDTNGNQADTIAAQDTLSVGAAVTWTFEVENTGNVDLADVVVTDVVTIDNGTAADPAGVVCDWATSSDPATPARNLSVGETVTCTASSTAEPGQYGNNSEVVGTPVANAAAADPDNPTPLQDVDGNDIADVTDEDPSHYFAMAMPSVDIEKDTNGFQADTGTGPLVFEGDPVTWTFEVENTGDVALGDVTVTDTVTTDNGTAADPAGVVCDWVNSSDPTTAANILSVGETVTCTASSTAELGQYANEADVVGTPLANDGSPLLDELGDPVPNVTDDDPSAYFGPEASIDIEKDTNGNQADTLAAQDVYSIGDAIVWTFEVENTGNVDLANVTVTDTVTIDNGTAADPAGVVCDWATSSDATTPAGNLSVGETVTCTSSSTAAAGQYRNLADVVGTPVADAVTADPVNPVPLQDETGADLPNVIDDDPSHYYATPLPAIDIEKDTNGNQADTIAVQDTLAIGAGVTWTFEVENTGNVDLADVVVTDTVTIDNGTAADPAGVVCDWATSSDATTPARNLSVGETVTCTASSTAEPGQYGNNSDVTGTPVADATTADPDAPVRLQDIAGDDLADVTDEDPSHYFGAAIPAIDIEKDTNGFQADTGTGPLVFEGDPVTWTFEVENIGNADLGDVTVTDTVTTDNGTAADPAGVVCDWVNSSDPTTAANILSVGETVTCTASSTAELGQYGNLADVVGTPLANDGSPLLDEFGDPVPNVTDDDPSAYFGPEASIDIEKDTNGNQADLLADQDSYTIGDAIVWTFEVENTGNVDLANVTVTDTVTTDNGTATDPAGVVCDWATSSDPATPARNLSVGETVTCTSSSTAEAGQYRNLADVVGTPVANAISADPTNPVPLQDETGADLPNVIDDDPSHYYGTPLPAIDIEKDTNGNQADTIAAQDFLAIGAGVTWTFEVENTGNVDLADVVVTDVVTIDNGTAADPAGVVCDWATSSDPATPARNLSVGETVTCTSSSIAEPGQYGNNSDVTGTPVADATTADPDAPVRLQDIAGDDLADVTDEDPSHYFAVATPSVDIEKDTNGFQADTGTGPLVFEGDPVTWTFEVENTGNVALGNVTVTDTVTTDNGTAADPAGVVCDWANSSDATTAANILSVGETVTCTASSTAELGQYANNSNVSGTPLDSNGTPLLDESGLPVPNVTDQDPSAYFGPEASIDIEKDTNGNQADVLADQDALTIGDLVTWNFAVENTGNVDLADVVVTDVVVIDNGTTPDVFGVVCDWANSSDAATPTGNLSVGETVDCVSNSTAAAGQYGNLADVVGTPVADAVTADPTNPVPLQDETGSDLPNVTDDDPSHYYGTPAPSVDIEKDTNGNQADTIAEQHNLAEGDAVVWTFEVVNNGDVDLADVVVTDVVTIDNGTVADPAGVVCDWATSSDAATPARNLSVGETVTCTSSSIATTGQYGNNSEVTGTPVADATTADPDNPTPLQDIDGNDLVDVTDEDPSHYFGAQASIVIEKDTNGNQADVLADQDNIAIGNPVVWTFVVENTGNVDLANVIVTDTVVTDNGTVADPLGVVCDWANSSDATTPARNLSIDETVTCTSSSIAAAGQYANNADVTGTPVDDATTADPDNPVPATGPGGDPIPNPTDEDPSHYFGAAPSIDIEKDTNGNQADTIAAQDSLALGIPVTWTFVVENTGNVDLSDVVVTDVVTIDNGTAADPAGVVCDWAFSSDPLTATGRLSIGETVTCTSTSTSVVGQYGNLADVTGTPVVDATEPVPVPVIDEGGQPLPPVTDDDPSHYFGEPLPSIDIEKDTNGNQADVIADQDIITAGDDVIWTFEVVNDGNVDLADVVVTDTVVTDNGTVADPNGVTCDWGNSSDAATPVGALSVGETVTCFSRSTAEAGQYANLADVTGTPVVDATVATPVAVVDEAGDPLDDVVDDDPSHYFGAGPSIDIEKDTNGNQADTTATQDEITAGDAVTWTFVVRNDGNTDLAGVTVADRVTIDNTTTSSPVVCDWANSSRASTPAGNLAIGETVTCTATGIAQAGQYGNLGDVVATPVDDAVTADPDAPTPLEDDNGDPLDDVTDDDPSHYFGGTTPSVDIEKDTNGVQADTIAEQGAVALGADLTWTFVVENNGDADLANVAVTDTVTIDNGTTHDAAGVVCDWANSSDAATPAATLSIGETVTCTATGVAGNGQYGNLAEVTGTPVRDASDPSPEPLEDPDGNPLPPVTDEDPSHVFVGSLPAIDIEKDTNGVQADTIAEQQNIAVGEDVVWTFEVTNIGNVDLAGVEVADAVTTDNGTAIDPDGVVCDWDNSSDAATPARNLSVGETVTCTSSSVSTADQYANLGTATGTPVLDATIADPDSPDPLVDEDGSPLPPVTDEDPSHYFGPVFDLALRKQLADGTNLATVDRGELVTFTLTVFNQGNVPGTDIQLSDYLPNSLVLEDDDWTAVEGGATYDMGDLVLLPGESTSVDITVRVIGGTEQVEIEAEAEISAAVASVAGGEPLLVVDSDGVMVALLDIDSTPDAENTEQAIEDEILNGNGDEDDHDRAGVVIRSQGTTGVPPTTYSPPPPQSPVITNPPPTGAPDAPEPEPPAVPLAYTGSNALRLAAIAGALIATGGVFVLGGRRRDDDDEDMS